MGQPGKNCLRGGKSSNLSETSPVLRWDFSWVGKTHSHIKDLLLEREIHHSAGISLRLEIPVKLGCLTSYKQLLNSLVTEKHKLIETFGYKNILFEKFRKICHKHKLTKLNYLSNYDISLY